MNYYALLPLTAFFANIILGCFILFRDPESRLNKLYSFFVFALAIWALGDFITFISLLPGTDLNWIDVSTFGSSLMPAFLLHFLLIFTKRKIISKKIFATFLYLPGLSFIFIAQTTDLIIGEPEPVYWGYAALPGILYVLLVVYIIGYIAAGLFFCYKFYSETISVKEKTQTKLLIVALSVPLVGGIITEVVPQIIGFKIIPLSTSLTTVTAVILAYAILRYKMLGSMSFSIQRKIIAGFLVVIFILVALGFFIIIQSQEALQKSAGENSAMFVNEAMGFIDKTIYYRFEGWESYVKNNLELFESIRKSNEEFENLTDIQEYINEKNQEWVSVSHETITPFMQELIDNILSDRLRTKTDFYGKKYGDAIFPEVFITNKYGANVAQTGKTSDYYQADEDWWQNTKRDGLYVEDVSYDESSGIYGIAICILIDDENGNFLGVIKVVFNIGEIAGMIDEIGLQYRSLSGFDGDDVVFKLLTKDGEIIYSTEKFEFLENVTDEMMSHFKEKDKSYFIGKNLRNREKEKLYAFEHSGGYREYKGNGWILIIGHETEKLFSSIYIFTNTFIIIIIVLTILSLLFSIAISRSISKPIIKLKEIACKIDEGKLDTKIKIETNDETGELASSFNKMVQNLKIQQENLENLVAERTKELETKIDELQRYEKVTIDRELKMIELKKQMQELKLKPSGGK